MSEERYYPADYSLEDWLTLRKGWRDPEGDRRYWEEAQKSALGPNSNQRTLKNVKPSIPRATPKNIADTILYSIFGYEDRTFRVRLAMSIAIAIQVARQPRKESELSSRKIAKNIIRSSSMFQTSTELSKLETEIDFAIQDARELRIQPDVCKQKEPEYCLCTGGAKFPAFNGSRGPSCSACLYPPRPDVGWRPDVLKYRIGSAWGWKEVVESFLHKNCIPFKVNIEEQLRMFKGGPTAVFTFENLAEKEKGIVEGFFQGMKSATEFLNPVANQRR